MDVAEFKRRGEEMVDYIVDYLDSVSERRITPDVFPFYLKDLLPSSAPETGESFETIMEDVEKYIMPGLTHWQHRRFHAYFPAGTSYPSILAETLSDIIGSDHFNWGISPACIELEKIVLDWLGKMIGLPYNFFHYGDDSLGGGFILNSASECVFVSMYNARKSILNKLKQENKALCRAALLTSLIAYCSKESHSCVEKAAVMLMVTLKVLDTDDDFRLRGETVCRAIETDKKYGLIPFFVSISIGSTSCGSCDPIDEIGPVCAMNGVWLHVDGAYGGGAMICPEFRHLLKGADYISSFNTNCSKMLLVNIDCSVLWIKDRRMAQELEIKDQTVLYPDFEQEGTPSSRQRNRVMKLWFVIRNYGVEGLQRHIRNHVRLAKMFENYIRGDDRFEVIARQFGLVVFRLRGSNILNKKLLMMVNSSVKLHVTASQLDRLYVIRFCVCSDRANEDDISYAWSVFCGFTSQLLEVERNQLLIPDCSFNDLAFQRKT